MRIIAIGDTHGRSFWKLIKEKEKWDKFIFIGDYFDTHETISPELQQINFKEICEFKEANPDKVVLLIGNHDEHYFPFMGNSGTSGYNAGAAPNYGHLLSTYNDLLQMAYSEGDILFSHAGIGEIWLENNFPKGEGEFTLSNNAKEIADLVNSIWKYKPLSFKFVSTAYNPYGDDIFQTPIWIRPDSLKKASQNMKNVGIIQIVGHTQQDIIRTNWGSYFFIDALGTSGEYLIIEDGEFKTGKI